MSDTWKQWEGQFVDGKFPLRQYLGGSEHSAVFLTERGENNQKTAIKFIQVEATEAEQQLSHWKAAAHLFHPHLLRIFESGNCRLGGYDLLYVVMECGQENLGQFLPQRPLTPAETRDVLEPVLNALAYLHREGFVHGHIRPSNIFAIDDEVKLSSDAVTMLSELHEKPGDDTEGVAPTRQPSVYDAPETARGEFSPASDVWSLGVTLVEALTQRLPAISETSAGSARPPEPTVPETLPALYLEIARNCLQREPEGRWSVAEITARLNPTAAAAAAATVAKVSIPAQVPPRISPAIVGQTDTYHVTAVARPPLHAQSAIPRDHYTKPRYDIAPPKLKRPPLLPKANYFILGFVGTLALLAILVLPKLFGHHGGTEQASSVEPSPTAVQKTPPTPVRTKNQQPKSGSKSPAPASAQVSTSPRSSAARTDNQASASKPPAISSAKTAEKPIVTAPSPAALRSETIPTVSADSSAKSSGSAIAKGEVLDQILPEVSQKAQATIRGTVRTSVKLHVDAAGNVIGAELYSPGPSKYFADLALNAVRRWDFAPAKLDGHNVASDWLVRFEFTQSATRVYPTQATP
jgi:eukaryotic-like serine/threonine-protein kinase